ncbi:MAG: acylphosphatase [Candidatus Methylomirabilia bacterium]
MAPKRLIIVVSGMVQGVWFRASTREEAIRLGLRGWVRNLPDGRVEALLDGEEHALRQMLAWCRVGSPGARVDRVDERWGATTNECEDFTIRR